MQFQAGYFEGRGSAKRWISSGRDVNKFEPGSHITLWCDGIDNKENQPPTKENSGLRMRNLEAAAKELKEIVENLNPDLALPQIRLWEKMIQAGQ